MAGHPPDLSEEQIAAMRARRSEGAGWAEIAREARAGMLPGTPAFRVHWSTVKKHLKDDESQLPAVYAELEAKLRQRSEINLRAMTSALEKNDQRRIRELSFARGAITQAIRGLAATRHLYRIPEEKGTEKPEGEKPFLAGLAAGDGADHVTKQDAVANGGGEQGLGRADSHATTASARAHGDGDLHTDHVDVAA